MQQSAGQQEDKEQGVSAGFLLKQWQKVWFLICSDLQWADTDIKNDIRLPA